MYGKWLYKEISTEYGACKVEIYRKNYTGVSIEIGALAADSLSIALENLGSITDPIGKSVCSFSIIDTDQVEYDDFFTPDATALKVVVSTRVGSGAYVTRWSGYVTPDFFAENLSYRTPISISARDNIGYLNDVDFDLTATTITVREFIQSAFTRIAEDYPMSLSFVSQKQTAEGILAIDATISTTLLREMSWGEALETILHDLGLQMCWVDNNTIAVLDLSQIPEYYATQDFNFIDASGYREIAPAWRELSQEQDFGLKENFFEGWLREDNITFVKSVVMRPPNATNWTTDIAYYVPNNWGVARDIYTTDPSYYGSKFGKKIFFTGVSEQNPTTTYFSWRQQIQSSIVPMKMSFKAFNSVLYPSEKYASLTTPSGRRLVAYNPKDAFHGQKVGEYLQIGLKANVLLHSGLKTYILKSEWIEISDDGAGWQLDFTLPKVELSYVEGNQATAVEPREEEITINIATIPYDGELEFRIYGWYIVGKHNYWEDDYSVTNYTFDWLKCLAYINEPTFSFNTDEADSGRETNVMIAEAHNIKQEESYIFGQTFSNGGGLNAYAGALVGTDGNELIGFQRNANATNYNLLELVGRELIHFNKKNYNRLSGTIKNLNKEPLMFNRLFMREGKKYAPYNYSLNVISNEMNITSMQEVEPYETATFNTIDSQITTGGGTVSGGNNTILQYSEEAGNEKRLYEMQTATEQEKSDAYVLVDKAGFPEARKVHISELGGFDVRELELYLEKNGYTALKTYWTFNEQDDTLRTTHNIVVEGGGAFGMGAESGGDVGGLGKVTIYLEGSNIPYETNSNGEVTIPAYPTALKNPYALTINGRTYDGSSAVDIIVSGDYLPITGGELNGWIQTNNFLRIKNTTTNEVGFVVYNGGTDWVVTDNSWTTPYRVLHEGNYTNYVLPLSGGTISNSSRDVLTLNSTDSFGPKLSLSVNGTIAGGIGHIPSSASSNYGMFISNFDGKIGLLLGSDRKVYITEDIDSLSKTYTVIHSGNIGNQSVNYANGAFTASRFPCKFNVGFDANSNESLLLSDYGSGNPKYNIPADFGYGTVFTPLSSNGKTSLLGQFAWDINHNTSTPTRKLWFRASNNLGWGNDWKIIAFTDSNVASATKLQTARTIWGKSFDGTQNVSGNLSIEWSKIYWNTDINNYYIGWNSSEYAFDFVNYYGHRFHSGGSERMRITTGGNVLIDTTTDLGNELQVYDSIAIQPNSGGYSGMHFYMNTTTKENWHISARGGEINHPFRLYYSPDNSTYNALVDVTKTGNVLIGSTTDVGAKLYVNGPFQAQKIKIYEDSTIDSQSATMFLNYNSANSILMCYGGGNVFIGSSWDSAYKLSVAGNTKVMGNLVVTGGGAFGSDIRYKDITSDRQLDLETIVNAPLFTFRWTDREDKVEHLGTSAQYWLDTQFKDAVNTANKDFFHLDYGALAVGIGISVAREVKEVKTEVELLKDEVRQLRKKLKEYETYGTIRI